MVLDIHCVCGKLNTANEGMAGQSINCIRCGRLIRIPARKPPPEPAAEVVPDIAATRPVPETTAPQESLRDYLYWVFILCLFPLAFGLGQVESKTFEQRLSETLSRLQPSVRDQAHAVWEQVQEGEADLDTLFAYMPEHRLEGAWLPRNSQMHWLFVLGSAVVLWVAIGLCFRAGSAQPLHLLGVGLFTATFGIALLLFLHYFSPTAIFLQAAEAADSAHEPDFFGALAYYTLAVGLFEEAVKLVPLMWYLHRYRRIEWRMACLWGLASGVGFGIAEGVMYSQSFYHGISTFQAYIERFASCVALHAIWTASASVSLYHCQDLLRGIMRWDEDDLRARLASAKDAPLYVQQSSREIDYAGLGLAALRVLIVVMFLHGLYDAALMRNMYPVALGAAIVSFGWLAWQVEDARRRENEAAPASAST